eukprot:TRINITY_DN24883_c0_g1_i1.p1 TRINITY_DN24883_c0_g1~~TRINITY_DN24883_c0_g1_i1.p1  ORF type:complete len:185 (+),score=37.99 TRINITY_DN24883_c0_g1_i1:74-556(+)
MPPKQLGLVLHPPHHSPRRRPPNTNVVVVSPAHAPDALDVGKAHAAAGAAGIAATAAVEAARPGLCAAVPGETLACSACFFAAGVALVVAGSVLVSRGPRHTDYNTGIALLTVGCVLLAGLALRWTFFFPVPEGGIREPRERDPSARLQPLQRYAPGDNG